KRKKKDDVQRVPYAEVFPQGRRPLLRPTHSNREIPEKSQRFLIHLFRSSESNHPRYMTHKLYTCTTRLFSSSLLLQSLSAPNPSRVDPSSQAGRREGITIRARSPQLQLQPCKEKKKKKKRSRQKKRP